jgi:hypothetical protein
MKPIMNGVPGSGFAVECHHTISARSAAKFEKTSGGKHGFSLTCTDPSSKYRMALTLKNRISQRCVSGKRRRSDRKSVYPVGKQPEILWNYAVPASTVRPATAVRMADDE